VKLTIRPEHLRTYRDVVALLVKYGGADLVRSIGLDSALGGDGHRIEAQGTADELASDLERMGPTFIKLGQLFSTRFDVVPVAYARSLGRLQDKVEPFSMEQAKQIVARELKRPIEVLFRSFESPVAAASIGQVHRATLQDGRTVAVKVQRPDVSKHVLEELDSLLNIAEVLDEHTGFGRRLQLRQIMDEFSRAIRRELDYLTEARHLAILANNLHEFTHIVVPRPTRELTTARVLTMDFIDGRKLETLTDEKAPTPLRKELADELLAAYLRQILVDGFFHADPHPGNVLLTDDGRLALLDLGMAGRLTTDTQERVLQLVLAISDGQGDNAATVALGLGEPGDELDEKGFRRDIGELVALQHGLSVEEMEVGTLVLEITRVCSQHGVRVPSELMLLGKTLLNLDQVGRALDPGFDPNRSIRQHASRMLQERMASSLSPSAMLGNAIEMRGLAQKLPARISSILDLAARNAIEIRIRSDDADALLGRLERIGNRMTIGVVLAALIVGAAILLRLETTFQILGYSGFAVFFFLLAAAAGVTLLASMLFSRWTRGRDR
jgi:predicted unusual protein kinase regulating ubiquinone biosynthesis (AarF/ABC1/UbiB family)